MVAAMALMESPAIVIGVILIRRFSNDLGMRFSWKPIIAEALVNGSVFLIPRQSSDWRDHRRRRSQSLEAFARKISSPKSSKPCVLFSNDPEESVLYQTPIMSATDGFKV